jgi:hypothetical protein
MKNLIKKITNNKLIESINNNKLLMGISIILLNILSKYVELNLTKTQEEALRNGIARELLVFIISFVATKDIVLSFLLTGTFIVLANYLFNEKSSLCIIKHKLNKINMEIDLNNDNKITEDEIEKALEVLRKAKKQKENQNQIKFLSFLNNDNFKNNYF